MLILPKFLVALPKINAYTHVSGHIRLQTNQKYALTDLINEYLLQTVRLILWIPESCRP
jgi:uncharacterized protein YbgA (DUF1722 family)